MPVQPGLTQVEKDKLSIDPDFDFRELARRPLSGLTPNVIGMFKWSGVYQQLQPTFFMIRLVTPGGLMTATQLRQAAELAGEYAQDQLCITTRQTLQFHWVRWQDIHKVLEGMAAVGMTTRNGCGDVTRNVVTCSLLGVCPHEVGGHARELIRAIATDPEIQRQQRNLPRKHKICVAGCGRACAQTLINCQGWVPVLRPGVAGPEPGWRFHAGGGLGARPALARCIFDWVPAELALAVVQSTIEVFRREGDRRNRAFARLKVVVDRVGPQGFGKMVLAVLRERGVAGLERIEPAASAMPHIGAAFLDGQEVVSQRQPGLVTVRALVPRGELSGALAVRLADWAERFGSGEVSFSNRQNVELRNVPAGRADELRAALREAGLGTAGHERLPDVVACVGTTVCRLAVADTPRACRRLLGELAVDEACWRQVGPLRINLTGCPNNCAHAWIADIGLRGRRSRAAEGAGSIEALDVFVGGSLAGAGRIAEWVAEVPAVEVAVAVRRLLDLYLSGRHGPEETFVRFAARVGVKPFQSALCTGSGPRAPAPKEAL
jgi:sulfite reductase beta subunit-like hemoprotein